MTLASTATWSRAARDARDVSGMIDAGRRGRGAARGMARGRTCARQTQHMAAASAGFPRGDHAKSATCASARRRA